MKKHYQAQISVLTLAAAMALGQPALAEGQRVAFLTPYLSAVATNDMAQSFEAEATARGWEVQVIDTNGDFGILANRLEDVVSAKVDAIVVASINPAQVQDQISKAAAADIPVFAIDGATADGITLNVTSDNYAMGELMTDYLVEAIGGEGPILKLFHSAHPGVRQRELALEAAMATNSGIEVVGEYYVEVPGQIDNSRGAIDGMLAANPGAGSVKGVWAAWDEPGIGAQLALEAAGREGVVITGIDGNPQALELIRGCTPFIATVAQNFQGMAEITAAQMAQVFDGKALDAAEMFAPATLITRESLGVSCN